MNEPARFGHVSRDRLLGEGSAFVRQLTRAQQAAAQQGTQHAADAHEEGDDAADEDGEAPAVTFNELWDARTTANHVGLCVEEYDNRLLDAHLWWPQAQGASAYKAEPAAGARSSKTAKPQLVQEGLARDRLLQRGERGPRWRAGGQYKNVKEYKADQELGAGRRLAAILLGDPAEVHQLKQPPASSSAAGYPANGSSADAAEWVCCNKQYPEDAPEPAGLTEAVASVAACGCVNPADAGDCRECGAPRWNGPDGQLHQRLWAVLQTADLSSASTKQLAARLTAESGSLPALGLQLQPEAVQEGVQAFLARRRAAAGASAASTAAGSAVVVRGSAVSPAAASPAVGDTVACPPAARGVYQQLVSWHLEQLNKQQLQNQPQQPLHHHHQQQQQQQLQVQPRNEHQAQQVQLDDCGRLHAAAAAAAALAPELLTSVFKERSNLEQAGGLKPVRMHNSGHPVTYTWVADVLEQAAAAAAQTQAAQNPGSVSQPTSSPLVGTSSPAVQHLPALHRPLPPSTLQQLLARKSALLRQEVIDYAQQMASKLPVVLKTTNLAAADGDDDSELLVEKMPVKDWLWNQKTSIYYCADTQYKDKLPAEDGVGDVPTVVRITCDDWPTVLSIRRHMLHILTAWNQLAMPRVVSTASLTTAERDQQELQLQQWLIAGWQKLPTAWCAAPPLALRADLAAWAAQQSHLGPQQQQQQAARRRGRLPRQQQQAQPEHQPGASAPSGAGAVQSDPEAVHMPQAKEYGQQPKHGLKRSRQQQGDLACSTEEQQQQQQQQCRAPVSRRLTRSAAAAIAGSSESPSQAEAAANKPNKTELSAAGYTPADSHDSSWDSSSKNTSADGDRGSESEEAADTESCRAASGDAGCRQEQQQPNRQHRRTQPQRQASQRHQGAASRQQWLRSEDADYMAEFDVHLHSIEDLLVPNTVDTCQVLPGRHHTAWIPCGIRTGAASNAAGAGLSSPWVTVGVAGVSVELGGLPAGMQAVLRQAAALGICSAVLQRTAGRLQHLVASDNTSP